MLDLLILVFFILLGSGLCSCTEAAIASISMMRVRQLQDEKVPGSKALLQIKSRMNETSNTVVLLNNLINIGGSVLVTAWVIHLWGQTWLGLCSGILTALVIIFAEIIPKTLGYHYPLKISLWVARPLYYLIILMKPANYLMNKVTSLFAKSHASPVTERDVLSIVKAAFDDGKISHSEYSIARRAFLLNDKKAGEINTPRTVLTYLYADKTIEECREKIISSVHSRLPIMGKSIDDVIGVALKDELLVALIHNKKEKKIQDFCHNVIITNESKKVDELLQLFIEKKQHMAMVFDEYGGLEGVVTLEDILEELMGKEIVDETDRVEDMESWAKKKAQEKLTSH